MKRNKWLNLSIVLAVFGIVFLATPFIIPLTYADYNINTPRINEASPPNLVGFGNVPTLILQDNDNNFLDQTQEETTGFSRIGFWGLYVAQNFINTDEPLTGFDIKIKRTGYPTKPLYVGLRSKLESSPYNADNYDYLCKINAEQLSEGDYTWIPINLVVNDVIVDYNKDTTYQIVLISLNNYRDTPYSSWCWTLSDNNPKPQYMAWIWSFYYEHWLKDLRPEWDMCFRTYTTISSDNGGDGGDDNGGDGGTDAPITPIDTNQMMFFSEIFGIVLLIGSAFSYYKYRKSNKPKKVTKKNKKQ